MQQATKCINAASCSLTLSAAAVSLCFHDNDQLETGLQIFLFAMTPICFAHQQCPPAAKMLTVVLLTKTLSRYSIHTTQLVNNNQPPTIFDILLTDFNIFS